MTFTELVETYSSHVVNAATLQAKYGKYCEEDNIAQMVITHKCEKHLKGYDDRSIAYYLHLWIKEGYKNLPNRVKEIAQSRKIKHHAGSVGYLHADGTYHWFTS